MARSGSPPALIPTAPPTATKAFRCGHAHGYSPVVGSPVASGRPRIRLAHCTAWPAAPLTRLSRAHRVSTHPVRASTRAVTWAQFEPAGGLGRGRLGGDHDEGLLDVGGMQKSLGVGTGQPLVPRRRPGVTGGQDPSDHWGEMGGEEHARPEGLLESRGCAGGSRGYRRKNPRPPSRNAAARSGPPGPGRPARSIDHDAARFDHPGPKQWRKSQGGRRRVTTGGSHQP